MRLASLRSGGLGIIDDDTVVTLDQVLPSGTQMVDLIGMYETLVDALRDAATRGPRLALNTDHLGAPVARPPKLWCAAGNYQRESSGIGDPRGRGGASDMSLRELLEAVFLKPSTAVIGPGENVEIPEGFGSVFPEIELCVVIGQRCRGLSVADAMQAVFGRSEEQ